MICDLAYENKESISMKADKTQIEGPHSCVTGSENETIDLI